MSMIEISRERIHVPGFVPAPLDPVPDNEKVAFLEACRRGQIDQVRAYCLKYPKSVNAQDEKGKSGLMLAARAGHYPTAEFLVSVPGYDINLEDENWGNALFDAARANSARLVELLLKNKIKVVVDNKGNCAGEDLPTVSPSTKMIILIGDAWQMQEYREFVILDSRFKERNKLDEKQIKEIEAIVGKKVKRLPLAKDYQIDSKKTPIKAVLNDQKTLKEIRDHFRQKTPESTSEAKKIITAKWGVTPSTKSMTESLKTAGITIPEKKKKTKE